MQTSMHHHYFSLLNPQLDIGQCSPHKSVLYRPHKRNSRDHHQIVGWPFGGPKYKDSILYKPVVLDIKLKIIIFSLASLQPASILGNWRILRNRGFLVLYIHYSLIPTENLHTDTVEIICGANSNSNSVSVYFRVQDLGTSNAIAEE